MKNGHTESDEIAGLPWLYQRHQKTVSDGKKIFDLVMQDKANSRTLKGIVYQESLLQLILYTLDHRTKVTSRANQDKSAKQRTAAAVAERQKIYEWCDANIERAWLPYKGSVSLAIAETGILANTSVRGYISAWRKTHPKE
jgi:hypothetical protein